MKIDKLLDSETRLLENLIISFQFSPFTFSNKTIKL